MSPGLVMGVLLMKHILGRNTLAELIPFQVYGWFWIQNLSSRQLPSQLGLKNTLTAPLQRGKTPPPNECPGYDTKQSDGEVPAVLELWRMRSTPSLPLLPGPLWPGVVAPDRALIYGLNRTNSILMLK